MLNPGNEQGTETLIDGRKLLRFQAKTFNKVCRRKYSNEAEGRCSEPDALVPLIWVSGADGGTPTLCGRTREVTDVITPGQGPDALVAAAAGPGRRSSIHGVDACLVSGLEDEGLRDGHPGLVLDDLSAPVRELPTNNEGAQLDVEPLGKVGEVGESVLGLGYGTSDGRMGGAAHPHGRQGCDLANMRADEARGKRSASQANGLLVVRVGTVEVRLVLGLARGGSERDVDQWVCTRHLVTKAAQGGSSFLEAIEDSAVVLVLGVEILLGDIGPDPGSGHEGEAPEDEAEELGGDLGYDVHGRGSGVGGVNTESRIGEGERPERGNERKKAQKKVVETRDLTQNVNNRTERNSIVPEINHTASIARKGNDDTSAARGVLLRNTSCCGHRGTKVSLYLYRQRLTAGTVEHAGPSDRDRGSESGRGQLTGPKLSGLKTARCGINAVRRGEQLRVDSATRCDRRREKRGERTTQTR
jgi:hypothetical protein